MKVRGIFLKLFFTYLAIIALVFVVFSAGSFLLFQNDMFERKQKELANQQQAITSFLEKAYVQGWNRDMVAASLEFSIARQDKEIYFYDQAGNFLYKIGNRPEVVPIAPDMIRKALAGTLTVEPVDTGGNKAIIASSLVESPYHLEEKAMSIVSFGFGRDSNPLKYRFLIAIAVVTFIAALCIWIVSKKMTAPLREMNRIALQFAKGQLDHRIQVRTKDEIGQLGESLNYMAQELSGMEQMRRDFLANVSHDLRSPITSIRGFLGAMIDGTIPEERQRQYLIRIDDAAERLAMLVEDLLEMARMDAGIIQIHPVTFNLSEQVRKTVARMEPQFLKKQIQVELFVNEDEDIYVWADPNRIDQVLTNLLQNAIHFSHPGGVVELHIAKEQQAVISVRDYGIGIKREDMPRIWERFYKEDKARTRKVGVGIGLSIVKHVLELHGSPVQVESEWGKGTAFTFKILLAGQELEA